VKQRQKKAYRKSACIALSPTAASRARQAFELPTGLDLDVMAATTFNIKLKD
jgi:hypothetical protein